MNTNLILKVIIVILIIYILFKTLKYIGIIKPGSEVRQAQIDTTRSAAAKIVQSAPMLYKPTDAQYYTELQKKNTVILKPAAAINLIAKAIRESMAGMGTDEQRLFSEFSYLKNKAQISQTADAYRRLFNSNMINDIMDDLSQADFTRLIAYIDSLPIGIK